MEEKSLSPQALSLAGLAVEFCKVLAHPEDYAPQDFLRECIRYIPRIYIAVSDIKPYEGDTGEAYDEYEPGAMSGNVTEEQYDIIREGIAGLLGEYDVYLDTPVEDMRFSDTPVGVSLAEQLADVFQVLGDFASTMSVSDEISAPDVLADLKYAFHTYLSDVLCSSLRAINMLYQSQALLEE